MTARPKRRAIPLRVKLASALIFAGFDPRAAAKAAGIPLPYRDPLFGENIIAGEFDPIEFDHDPSRELRADRGDLLGLMPHDDDPRHIVPRLKAPHRVKTSADQTAIAKTKRLEAGRLVTGFELTTRLRSMDKPKPKRAWPKGRKMQSRPFPERWKR